jgi:hypothetical protein
VPQPSYTLLSAKNLTEPGLATINKQFREHLEEINRLAGASGPVAITNDLSVGTNQVFAGSLAVGIAQVLTGTQSPEGQVTAPPGSIFLNTTGGANKTIWIKESGNGKVGWIAK